jgi:hypothetical protein
MARATLSRGLAMHPPYKTMAHESVSCFGSDRLHPGDRERADHLDGLVLPLADSHRYDCERLLPRGHGDAAIPKHLSAVLLGFVLPTGAVGPADRSKLRPRSHMVFGRGRDGLLRSQVER